MLVHDLAPRELAVEEVHDHPLRFRHDFQEVALGNLLRKGMHCSSVVRTVPAQHCDRQPDAENPEVMQKGSLLPRLA